MHSLLACGDDEQPFQMLQLMVRNYNFRATHAKGHFAGFALHAKNNRSLTVNLCGDDEQPLQMFQLMVHKL